MRELTALLCTPRIAIPIRSNDLMLEAFAKLEAPANRNGAAFVEHSRCGPPAVTLEVRAES